MSNSKPVDPVPERNHPEISNSPERHQRNPDSVNKGKALMQRSQQVKHQEEMAKDWEGDESSSVAAMSRKT